MEQFSLEKWLQNKSRKVVTRDGSPVRIVCWDMKSVSPIIGVILHKLGGEFERNYAPNGRFSPQNETEYDLFFTDEEKELTEFEKELQIIISEASHWTSDDGSMSTYCQFGDKEIKKISAQILYLARNEITKEVEQKAINHTYAYQNGYENGKYDALKDLPKWKKAERDEELDCHVAIQQDDRVVLSDFVQKDEYYITLDVLKKLPKEE